MTKTIKHKLTVQDLKTRLDKFLANKLSDISRSQIQRDIEHGSVEVNGQRVLEAKFVVRVGDEVIYKESGSRNQEAGLKPTNTPLKVLYHDHGLLIIDKPAGMVVHPGAGFKGETLASALLYQFHNIHLVGEDHRPGIVHRLDKDTSGVMLVATTQEMYEHLKEAFQERKIKKEYIALVSGKVEKTHGKIDLPIGKSKTDFRKQTTKNPVDAKPALTEYEVLEYLKNNDINGNHNKKGVDEYTLLMVKLHTGRTHQIRVHFSSLGYPLVGDDLYGPRLRPNFEGKNKISVKGLHRQFLHAKRIEVQLPNGTWIEAESDLADDLKEVLENLNSKVINQL